MQFLPRAALWRPRESVARCPSPFRRPVPAHVLLVGGAASPGEVIRACSDTSPSAEEFSFQKCFFEKITQEVTGVRALESFFQWKGFVNFTLLLKALVLEHHSNVPPQPLAQSKCLRQLRPVTVRASGERKTRSEMLAPDERALQRRAACEAANASAWLHRLAAEGGRCPLLWDGLLCWPPTRAGALAVQPCIDELYGIRYDVSQNATRQCFLNGTWNNQTNYEACKEVWPDSGESLSFPSGIKPGEISENVSRVCFINGTWSNSTNSECPELVRDFVEGIIFHSGFCLSVAALVISVFIFHYFKELKCLRNTIHTNLMWTFIFFEIIWIVMYFDLEVTSNYVVCAFVASLFHYFYLTNFLWMFVEGFYLFLLVVVTFTTEKLKLRVYVLIGWGIPVFIVILWALVKYFCEAEVFSEHLNILITKLRSAYFAEMQQYLKAAKALLVLFPLLGGSYILTIQFLSNGAAGVIFRYTRAVLISLQGLAVALFYCFLNAEVQSAVARRVRRWREARRVAGDRRLHKKRGSCSASSHSRESVLMIRSGLMYGTHDNKNGM
ncbi:CRF/DH receptor 2 variant A [Gryllus bimaculatus]|nr:CRF/DH receptor 2 variant A [Gryllus bimaculatus]